MPAVTITITGADCGVKTSDTTITLAAHLAVQNLGYFLQECDRFLAIAQLRRDVEAKTSCCGFGTFDGRGHTCFESLQLILDVRWRTSLQNLSWRRP